jgi:hypothetical protein
MFSHYMQYSLFIFSIFAWYVCVLMCVWVHMYVEVCMHVEA